MTSILSSCSTQGFRRTLHALTLVALLAGLIPPPFVRNVAPSPVAELAAALLPEPATAQAAAFAYEVTPNQAIADNSCPTGVTSTINVPDNFTINDLNVGLTIDHTYRNDLDVTLQSPAGPSVTLFTDIGSNGSQNFDILLDDEAASDISTLLGSNHTTTSPYYQNLFNLEGAAVLSAFDGQNALGNWTLTICDDTAQDTGTLRRFALQFDGTSAVVAGHITGAVFQDYDSDGTKDNGTVVDNGVANVTVTAYAANGATFSAVTNSTGAYDIDASAGTGPFRIEFTNLPSGYYPSYHASHSGSNSTAPNSTAATAGATVQFVPTAGVSNVNLGISYPCESCQNDPYVAVPANTGGNQTSAGYTLKTTDAVKVFQASAAGTSPTVTQGASQAEVATTYGQAFNSRTKELYTAAYIKRHGGLASGGAGQIFRTNLTNPTSPGAPTAWVTIPNTGFTSSNTTRGLPDNPATTDSRDPLAMTAVGKAGLGDLDMSADFATLYAMNLFDKSIYPVNTSTGAVGSPIAVPSPTCTNGQWRPFALEVYKGIVYAGGVCDASGVSAVTTDLTMQVFPYNPTTGAWGAGLFAGNGAALDYDGVAGNNDRECALTLNGTDYGCRWTPWVDTWSPIASYGGATTTFVMRPMPMLTDLEFDRTGNLILGLRDRWGDLTGYLNCDLSGSGATCPSPIYAGIASGDILRATPSGSNWVVESRTPVGTEFFQADEISVNIGDVVTHNEVALGALAHQPGANSIGAIVYDPFDLYSAGLTWFTLNTGLADHEVELLVSTNDRSLAGKSNGLGDIELLCDPALIEIGNRVWNDADGDGIQDPTEAPISGVIVELYKNGVKVGQATTDATGEYYFVSGTSTTDANTNDNIIHDSSGLGIVPGTGTVDGNSLYEIRIPNVSGASKQAALGSNNLTTANVGSKDAIDSNGTTPGGQTYASYVIPYADLAGVGYNSHTYDFGFGPLYDWGDLPDDDATAGDDSPNSPGYSTNITGTLGASHVLTTNLRIGTDEDSEITGQPNATATGDDTAGTPDDEDGVTLPTFTAGSSATVNVSVLNNTGSAATLYGFIDWNGDGDFLDSNERVTASVTTGAASQTVNLNFTVPSTATTSSQLAGALGARFRLSTASTLTADGAAPNGEVEDYLIQVLPLAIYDLALRKTLVTPGPFSAGQVITFNLTVFNQGNVTATHISLVDYIPGGLTLADTTNWQAAGGQATSVGHNAHIHDLPAGSNATRAIAFTINPGFSGAITNTAEIMAAVVNDFVGNPLTVDADSTPDSQHGNQPGEQVPTRQDDSISGDGKNGGDEDDHDWAMLTVAPGAPSFTLSKQRITPDPVRVGDDVTFTIRITNTGSSTITVLPLRDLYDISKLLYLTATALPDDSINDGQMDWSDLTQSFSLDLAPNQSFAVTTVFVARNDTTALPGGATINTALSPISPTLTVTAPVRIEAPTAVETTNRGATYANSQVTLLWTTLNESNITGFRLLRRDLTDGGAWVQIHDGLISAQLPGQATGTGYTFTDGAVVAGRTYLYLVEILDASGSDSRQELGMVKTGQLLFLPQIVR